MYSVYGDTVLDPFWGTGTTSIAAMVAGRSSIGYELERAFVDRFEESVENVPQYSQRVNRQRLADHEAFVEQRLADGETFDYDAEHYDFPVTTRQEQSIRLYAASAVRETDGGYAITHSPVPGSDS
jgi:hypothetical protein